MTPPFQALEPAQFPWFDYRGFTFSLGLQLGGDIVDSGHSGSAFDPAKGKPGIAGDMADQARTSYAKHAAILGAGGLDLSQATRVVENVTVAGLPHYAQAEKVRREVFGDHRPSVSTVVIDRLVRRQALIEIEVHASPGGGRALATGPDEGWRRHTVRTGHDGEVYLPTLLPVDAQGDVVAPGDLPGQYRYCLERAGELLAAAGLTLGDIVSTTDFTTPASAGRRSAVERVRRELLAPRYPSATALTMSALHRPEVLVALDVVASTHPGVAVNPGWDRYDELTQVPAVSAGRMLYCSGLAAIDQGTGEPAHPGDLRAQAELTYESLSRTLAAAGTAPDHLLTTVEYVTAAGLGDYRAVADVRARVLSAPYPASTGIVAGAVGAPSLMLGVQATAVLPEPAGASAAPGES